MTPPKTIYLQVCGDCNDHECDKCKFEDLEEITWCVEPINKKDVVYFSEQAIRDLLRKEYEQMNRIIDALPKPQMDSLESDNLIIVDASIENAIRKLKGETK